MAHFPKYVTPEYKTTPLQPIAAGKTGEPEVLTAAGALSLDTENTDIQIDQGVDQAMTLAAGDSFQRKVVAMTVQGGAGNAVLTPAGGVVGIAQAVNTTITFNSAGDWVSLIFLNGKWNIDVANGVVLA